MPSGNKCFCIVKGRMAIAFSNNLQNIPADTGFCATFKIKLNLPLATQLMVPSGPTSTRDVLSWLFT